MMLDLLKFERKKNFDGPEVPYRCPLDRENGSRFSTAKSISFYSEFNADSEYVILF
jgi:hypothetical protein